MADTPTTIPQKPCGCDFADRPKTGQVSHDELVGLETMHPVFAALLVAAIIGDSDQSLFNGIDEFGLFVMQHNWADPVAMASLASEVEFAAHTSWSGRVSA